MGIIAGLFSGIGIALGLGGNTVLILFLTFLLGIEQYNAQYISLLCFFPASLVSCIYNFKKGNIHFKNCIIIILFGIIGSIAGSLISSNINISVLRKFFGIFLLAAILYESRNLYFLIKNKNAK